ncbi:hypothetical protein [Geobacillus vulcani]|uniref:hypothetical protein n=1 Tax=Geobacillus vulcani TaxID=135517 RepID=UPI0012EBA59B|nr:hypothetical protein [Geobacillus vulcani]
METFGTLTFINEKPFLELEIGELVALNNSFIVEDLNGQTIALNESYAGKQIVIRKAVA